VNEVVEVADAAGKAVEAGRVEVIVRAAIFLAVVTLLGAADPLLAGVACDTPSLEHRQARAVLTTCHCSPR
jgi:hypothetical protein